MTTHLVMFYCNDERGNFAGRVSEIEIADEIKIIYTGGRPPKMRYVPTGIKIGRRVYACSDTQTNVGNVFWDSAKLPLEHARSLILDLLLGSWAVEEFAEEGPFADLVRKAKA